MKMKCVIVDDEPLARRILIKYIQKIEDLELVCECKNVIQLHELLLKEDIDLIFLDIEMPLIKGTEFLRSYNHDVKVIFTTAHKDYAVEAFDLNVVDYLLKPISFPRFFNGIQRFFKSIDDYNSHVTELPNFLSISINRRTVNINCDDIFYIESMKDYVLIYTNDNCYKTKKTLSSVEGLLKTDFFRSHRSFLVNKTKIESISNKKIILNNGKVLPVGKTYQDNINSI